jgi:hypothetical protein
MSFKLEVIEKIAALMTAAFGLIAALAWNEAIKALVAEFLSSGSELTGFLVYAIIVTIIAVVATIMIARTANRIKAAEEGKAK